MRKSILILLIIPFCFIQPQADSLLIISEIMFYPAAGNNEFIEIYNLSEIQSVDLRGYKIKYYTSKLDTITDAGFGTIIPPGSYAVIFEGDYDLSNGIYKNIIPAAALILKISDNSFGSSGMANTTSRPIILLNSADVIIDSCFYSADNQAGVSDEKIIMNKNAAAEWANSLTQNGTPGFRNSVTPLNYNLSIDSLTVTPDKILLSNSVKLKTKILNRGFKNSGPFKIQFYDDANYDSLSAGSELIKSIGYENINKADSVYPEFLYQPSSKGRHNIIVEIIFNTDEYLPDNFMIISFDVFVPEYHFNDLVINEVMYEPANEEPEWIEIFNKTGKSINLRNWTISDNSNRVTLVSSDVFIEPGSFLVISKDSSISKFYTDIFNFITSPMPSFNNNGDAVVIKDSLGITIDSLLYKQNWKGITGRSLERKELNKPTNDSTNWSASLAKGKGTPGKINSITQKNYDVKAERITFSPENPFFDDDVSVSISLKNIGKFSASYYLKLFEDADADSIPDNEINRSTYFNLAPGDSAIHSIGYKFSKISKRTGAAVKIICTDDQDTTNNYAYAVINPGYLPKTVLINEVMFNPAGEEPEWIELYNNSSDQVRLNSWLISDVLTTPVKMKTPENISIPSKSFLVITNDSSISDYHLNIPAQILKMNLPLLNNDKDGVALIDDRGIVIDSMFYSGENNHVKGYSLERKSIKLPSTSTGNWSVSIDNEQSTPGRANSITPKQFDLSARNLFYTPQFPFAGDDIFLSANILNTGEETAGNYKIVFYYDADNDNITDETLSEVVGTPLYPNDSLTISSPLPIKNLRNKTKAAFRIDYSDDENTKNNFVEKYIEPGYSNGTLKINEIMYAPLNGEPEWIELINTSSTDSVNLKNWSVSDLLTSPTKNYITLNDEYLVPGEYLVISNDSAFYNFYPKCDAKIKIVNFGSLGNHEDGIVVCDLPGDVIDSVFYNSTWGGNNGCSLERKELNHSSTDSSNWGTANHKIRTTPGKINSLSKKDYDVKLSAVHTRPEEPVIGDDISFFINVQNTGKLNADFYLNIFEDTDLDSLPDNLLLTTENIRLSQGDSINYQTGIIIKNLASRKMYYVEAVYLPDQDTLNNSGSIEIEPGYLPSTIIINEIMYAPGNGGTEWIELLNASPKDSVNIRDWFISDVLPDTAKKIITLTDEYISPEGYLIISKDSSFYNFYPQCNSKVKIVNFGSLGNQEDGIAIYDFRCACIDSVFYRSTWGGNNGRSLERISYTVAANDGGNWSSSLSEKMGTPGAANSSVNLLSYPEHSVIINEIMYDPASDNSEYIELVNISNAPINIGGWTIEDANENKIKVSEVNFSIAPQTFYVVADDSLMVSKYSLNNFPYIEIIGNSGLGLSKDGEPVLLKDAKNNLIDSVYYYPAWQNKNILSLKNISLEKINPYLNGNLSANWSSSVNGAGGTPGKQNSIFTINQNTSSKISISPNPFSPDNDGFEDFTLINYQLTKTTSQIRIRIFDSRGYLVRTLTDNRPSGANGSIVFNGLDGNNNPLRMGIYIVLLEAVNENSGVLETLKTVAVIARKLN